MVEINNCFTREHMQNVFRRSAAASARRRGSDMTESMAYIEDTNSSSFIRAVVVLMLVYTLLSVNIPVCFCIEQTKGSINWAVRSYIHAPVTVTGRSVDVAPVLIILRYIVDTV